MQLSQGECPSNQHHPRTTSITEGLTSDEVQRRRAVYGSNTLAEPPRRSAIKVLLSQYQNTISLLLLAATAISFFLGEHVEGGIIALVLALNGVIGFFLEVRAERALEALKREQAFTARVVRNGAESLISASELVPGDLVLLNSGDRVPADGTVIDAVRLRVVEATLTGEPFPVEKNPQSLTLLSSPLAERSNEVFLGTSVADGRGRFIVTRTGKNTTFGEIGQLVSELTPGKSPLERNLRALGETLVVAVLIVCAVIAAFGWYRGEEPLPTIRLALSLAIAAVPEGLTAVATMALALGMVRMSRRGALLRNLPAVETLGSTTILCTDKTGTLTKNEMTVTTLCLVNRRLSVTGTGYSATGAFFHDKTRVSPTDPHLRLALQIGALCNDAKLVPHRGGFSVLGDPTEGALLVAALKAGISLEQITTEFPREWELPFCSEKKWMATTHRAPDGGHFTAVKGAASIILDASNQMYSSAGEVQLTSEERKRLLQLNGELAGEALRVIALAFCRDPDAKNHLQNLTFVALVGMVDPLREEAQELVARCQEAGIRVVMITGDQFTTASAIASQLGIRTDKPVHPHHALEGDALFSAAPHPSITEHSVFARVTPHHKLQIIEEFQRAGHIVAMTGDGVNDAPALKKADIGIALGAKCSEVAKEAADLVITDDNLATIVSAIEHGRTLYANILTFVRYLFSCNLSELTLLCLALICGLPSPLTPIQLLWLNMVTDVLPALALVLEPSTAGMMQRPPRAPNEPILSRSLGALIAFEATVLSTATLAAFWWGLTLEQQSSDTIGPAQTMAFTTLALSQCMHAFTANSFSAVKERRNWWLIGAVSLSVLLQLTPAFHPALGQVLGTSPLTEGAWKIVLFCSFAPTVVFAGLRSLAPIFKYR